MLDFFLSTDDKNKAKKSVQSIGVALLALLVVVLLLWLILKIL